MRRNNLIIFFSVCFALISVQAANFRVVGANAGSSPSNQTDPLDGHFVEIDLGPGTPVAVNNSGQVLIHDGADSKIWDSGNFTIIPDPSGFDPVGTLDLNNHGHVMGSGYNETAQDWQYIIWEGGYPTAYAPPDPPSGSHYTDYGSDFYFFDDFDSAFYNVIYDYMNPPVLYGHITTYHGNQAISEFTDYFNGGTFGSSIAPYAGNSVGDIIGAEFSAAGSSYIRRFRGGFTQGLSFYPMDISSDTTVLGRTENPERLVIHNVSSLVAPVEYDGVSEGNWRIQSGLFNEDRFLAGPGIGLKRLPKSNGYHPNAYQQVTLPSGFIPTDISDNGKIVGYKIDGNGDRQAVMLVTLQIVPDWNHDRKIDFVDIDKDPSVSTLYFWINDDGDIGDVSIGDSDEPGQPLIDLNWVTSEVDGRCDLSDFIAIWLDLHEVLNVLPPSDNVKFKLSHEDSAVKVLLTGLEKEESGRYLVSPVDGCGWALDEDAYQATTVNVPSSGVELPGIFLEKIKSNPNKGVLLLEGMAASDKPLVLEIWRNNELISTHNLGLSLSGVESMFRWINIREDQNSTQSRIGEPINYPDSLCEENNIFFVHGFKVDLDGARAWNAEFFKRLYHSGSRAKFWGVTWDGDVGLPLAYQNNVYNAWLASEPLSNAIGSVNGSKTVLAHSLGNMVVCNLIKHYGVNFETYFMIDAAIASEAFMDSYYNTSNYLNPMLPLDWIDYNENTWSCNWKNYFENPDLRSKLNWVNLYADLLNLNTDIINIYSSGDEVFEIDFSVPSSFTGGLFHLERYAWQKQEVLKGTGDAGGTGWAGWGFERDLLGNIKYTSSAANSLTPSQLVDNPVFANNPQELFVSDNDTDKYHEILAKGIPALSYAVGRLDLEEFENNYDLNFHARNSNGWGRTGSPYEDRWLHNDIKDMAYYFTYKAFDYIVTSGDL